MAFDYFVFARAVRDSELLPSERLVLLAIGLRADSLGECYPGQRLLGHDTGLNRRSVGRVLEQLTEKGAVVVQKRSGRSTNYRIGTWDTMSHGLRKHYTCDTVSHATPCPTGCDTTSHVGGTPRPMGWDTMSPDLPTDPPNDLPTEAAGRATSAAHDSSTPSRPVCVGCDDVEVNFTDELCPACVAAEQASGSQARQQPPRPQAGEPAEPAFARPDPTPQIAERIRGHKIFNRLNADHLAETNACHVIEAGKRIEWVLASIDSCAGDADAAESTPLDAGDRWSEGHKAKMIRRYIRRASARDVPERVADDEPRPLANEPRGPAPGEVRMPDDVRKELQEFMGGFGRP